MGLTEGIASIIAEQNSPKRFIKKISITTTAGVTAIGTVTADDYAYTVAGGSTICVQSDVDFFYELRKTGQTTAVTDLSGARPGTKVLAGQQEFITTGSLDILLDLKAASTSGTVAVFLVRA
jgi:hypothetical protein